ncbi:MAG: aminotransferase class IV [Chitinophagales bacterium]|nr:aminotransferase class IV [Chitinophagales bacterium]
MSLFIESIKILNGRCYNLPAHEKRMHQVMQKVFNSSKRIRIKEYIQLPPELMQGLIKARITYSHNILDINYQPYTIRSIQSAKLVYNDDISYPYKSVDRTALLALYEQRKACDEIIIIKNGLVTDALNYNLVFQKDDHFYTPKAPLLQGTRRSLLLKKGILNMKNIDVASLEQYDSVHFINAMTNLKQCHIMVKDIRM